MVKLQELIPLFAIFIALIPLAKCGSFVTVTEEEAVQLEFPYLCDSNKVTIQIGNKAPFYSSTVTANLYLPNYQLHRFSVTDGNCSVQVQITPVKRIDEATYICQAYSDNAIQSRFTRIRLKVNYPPGDVSCTWSINNDAVGDWVPLQCTAPAGSLTGQIYCYQDSKRLPPMSKLVQNGDNLTQTLWARKEYAVFCCSSTLDQPKDMCECDGFVWDPFYTEKILNPCPVITAGQGAITKGPLEKSGDHLFTAAVNPSTSKTKKNNVKSRPLLWVGGIAILILVTALVIVTLYLCHVKKTNTNSLTEKKEGHPEKHRFIKKQECGSQTSRKMPPILLNIDKARTKSSSWGYLRSIDIEGIFPIKGSLKAKSMGTLHLQRNINNFTDRWVSNNI